MGETGLSLLPNPLCSRPSLPASPGYFTSFPPSESLEQATLLTSGIIILAGVLAKQMGLPIELVCAVNDNNIVHNTLSMGDFAVNEALVKTWSTAMDIQAREFLAY